MYSNTSNSNSQYNIAGLMLLAFIGLPIGWGVYKAFKMGDDEIRDSKKDEVNYIHEWNAINRKYEEKYRNRKGVKSYDKDYQREQRELNEKYGRVGSKKYARAMAKKEAFELGVLDPDKLAAIADEAGNEWQKKYDDRQREGMHQSEDGEFYYLGENGEKIFQSDVKSNTTNSKESSIADIAASIDWQKTDDSTPNMTKLINPHGKSEIRVIKYTGEPTEEQEAFLAEMDNEDNNGTKNDMLDIEEDEEYRYVPLPNDIFD